MHWKVHAAFEAYKMDDDFALFPCRKVIYLVAFRSQLGVNFVPQTSQDFRTYTAKPFRLIAR